MMKSVPDNRNYKDSVFVDLFSTDEKAKERFLSLYNALSRNVRPWTFLDCEFAASPQTSLLFKPLPSLAVLK